jgi:zinc transport system permease protein
MANSLSSFFEAWELFRDPALSGAVAGATLGFLGIYIALRRLVFLSAAMTQAAGLGVMAAGLATASMGLPPLLGAPTAWALILSLLGAAALRDDDRQRLSRDQRLGILYLLGAAGAILIGSQVTLDAHDVESILFGSAVAVLPEDFRSLVAVSGLIAALHVWLVRGFLAASFDADGARARGIPVAGLEATLLVTLALAISVSTRTIGALPVFAFSTLPAIAAARVTTNLRAALLLAASIGAAAGFGGYVAAFMWELPVGASQAVLALVFVAVSELVRRRLRI